MGTGRPRLEIVSSLNDRIFAKVRGEGMTTIMPTLAHKAVLRAIFQDLLSCLFCGKAPAWRFT